MAYPGSFLRLVMGGPLYTDERWSMGLSLVNWSGAATTDPTTVSAGVLAAVETFIGQASISAAAELDIVKLNRIGTDGKYVREAVEHRYEGTLVDGGGTTYLPAQVSLAVSLQTAATRGLACRGRIFLPSPSAGIVTATGVLGSSVPTAVATATTALINALNTALDPYAVSVVSNVREGAFREVKSVRVGNVLDTIRSRRTQFTETYQQGADVTGFGDHDFVGAGGTF